MKKTILFTILQAVCITAYSQVLYDVSTSTFCKTINKVIAEYPTKFEAVKGEKINDPFITKWDSKITVSTDSKCEVYSMSDGLSNTVFNTWHFELVCKEDWKATNSYENMKKDLNFCTYVCGAMGKKETTFENSPTLKRYTMKALLANPGYEEVTIQLSLNKETEGYRVTLSIGNPVGF